jgi:hypothetical protein
MKSKCLYCIERNDTSVPMWPKHVEGALYSAVKYYYVPPWAVRNVTRDIVVGYYDDLQSAQDHLRILRLPPGVDADEQVSQADSRHDR